MLVCGKLCRAASAACHLRASPPHPLLIAPLLLPLLQVEALLRLVHEHLN